MQRFLAGMDEKNLKIDSKKKNILDALRYFVGKIVENEACPKFNPTQQFISACTGLVFVLLDEHMPKELILFARHDKRKMVMADDLFLYCRKTSLRNHLKQHHLTFVDVEKDSPKKKNKKKSDIE